MFFLIWIVSLQIASWPESVRTKIDKFLHHGLWNIVIPTKKAPSPYRESLNLLLLPPNRHHYEPVSKTLLPILPVFLEVHFCPL